MKDRLEDISQINFFKEINTKNTIIINLCNQLESQLNNFQVEL